MPIYDFICKQGHTFEKNVSWETKPPKCPECGKPSSREFPLTAPGVVKGGTPKHH
jgi:putative FmdB family regulatory protein